jgi:glycosyltransferase involved in cell wall biosynthesis
MRVAITYQHSLYLGGSERVLEILAEMYPTADFFCMVARPDAIPEKLRGRVIHTTFLNAIPGIRKLYPYLLFAGPLAAETLDLRGYDLVISSDGSHTMGVVTDQDSCHLSYCHSPHRSLWDQYSEYRNSLRWPVRPIFTLSAHYARNRNFLAAQRIDKFIANSEYIAKRIRKFYRRSSTVIYPPVNTEQGYLAKGSDSYYLSVGRLSHLKRLDLPILACNQLKRRLLVVGTGPDEKRLKKIAGPTIEFLGRVPDDELGRLYSRCRAFVFASDEDFGIVPVEAQSYGRPVIAFGHGGSLETVIDSTTETPGTGVLFPEQNVASIRDAILYFESIQHRFRPELIQEHARQFSTANFVLKMSEFVDNAYSKNSLSPVEETDWLERPACSANHVRSLL